MVAPKMQRTVPARLHVLLARGAFARTGFTLVPIFLLLEVFLKHFVALSGGDRNAARFTLASAPVAGFYGAWFGVRSL